MTPFCLMLILVEGWLSCYGPDIPAPPPIEQMRIFATSYNWNLGGVNCDEDCSHVANGLETTDTLLDRTAACPIAWVGRINTTVITLNDGSQWYCIDTFGAPENREPIWLCFDYYDTCEWVIRVDFAASSPAEFIYNQELLSGWTTHWRPVAELLP